MHDMHTFFLLSPPSRHRTFRRLCRLCIHTNVSNAHLLMLSFRQTTFPFDPLWLTMVVLEYESRLTAPWHISNPFSIFMPFFFVNSLRSCVGHHLCFGRDCKGYSKQTHLGRHHLGQSHGVVRDIFLFRWSCLAQIPIPLLLLDECSSNKRAGFSEVVLTFYCKPLWTLQFSCGKIRIAKTCTASQALTHKLDTE